MRPQTMMSKEEQNKFLAALEANAELRAAVQRALKLNELFILPGEIGDLVKSVQLTNAGVNGLINHEAESQRSLHAFTEQVSKLAQQVSKLTEQQGMTAGDVGALVATTRELLGITQSGFEGVRFSFEGVRVGFEGVRADARALVAKVTDLGPGYDCWLWEGQS